MFNLAYPESLEETLFCQDILARIPMGKRFFLLHVSVFNHLNSGKAVCQAAAGSIHCRVFQVRV